jgi:hypothetical protein
VLRLSLNNISYWVVGFSPVVWWCGRERVLVSKVQRGVLVL